MVYTLILLMLLSILKINYRKLKTKNFYFLPIVGFMALTSPFIKYPSSVKITDANPLYIHYEKLSGLDMVWESVEVFLNPSDKLYQDSGIVSGIVALLIAVVFLVLLAGVALKKKPLIFYTAILLFAAFFVNLMLLAKEGFVTLRWGYFVYLVIQAAIILLFPVSSKEQAEKAIN